MLTPFAVVRPVVLLARCAPGLASGALFEAPPSLVARRELLAPQSRRRRAPPARCAPGLASGALFEAPPSLVARRELLAPQSRRRRAPPARCAPGLASGALFEAPPARCASGSPSVAGGRELAGGGAGHGQHVDGDGDQLAAVLPVEPGGRPVGGVDAR